MNPCFDGGMYCVYFRAFFAVRWEECSCHGSDTNINAQHFQYVFHHSHQLRHFQQWRRSHRQCSQTARGHWMCSKPTLHRLHWWGNWETDFYRPHPIDGEGNVFSLSVHQGEGTSGLWSHVLSRGSGYPLASGPGHSGGRGVLPSSVSSPVQNPVPGPTRGERVPWGISTSKICQMPIILGKKGFASCSEVQHWLISVKLHVKFWFNLFQVRIFMTTLMPEDCQALRAMHHMST